jgi:phage major head subunit gpT-like protein
MGRDTALHPDELVFGLLGKGFETRCFDGQYFFDVEHPVGRNEPVSVSNFQTGTGSPWFLLDCGQALKPMIHQQRIPFGFTKIDADNDERVFFKNEYVYGTRGRSNAGFGLWQLAFASRAELNAANYEAARMAMQSFKSDSGKPLGIQPTHLVVPPSLEGAGRRILKALSADGSTNEWAGSAELLVTPFL